MKAHGFQSWDEIGVGTFKCREMVYLLKSVQDLKTYRGTSGKYTPFLRIGAVKEISLLRIRKTE